MTNKAGDNDNDNNKKSKRQIGNPADSSLFAPTRRRRLDDDGDGEDDGDDNAHTTALGLADFVISLLLVVAAAMGQQQHHRNFHESPMTWTPTAAPMWKRFARQCNMLEKELPECCRGAVGKHCFSTTSHLMVNHLLVQSFSTLKLDRTLAKRLLGADEALLTSFAHAELPT